MPTSLDIVSTARISKEEAWQPRPDEVSIPVRHLKNYHFTRRWFKFRNQCTYSTLLPKKFTGEEPVNLIQIGVFEGYDLVWSMQNLLQHPDSRVAAIDPWLETTKLSQDQMDEIYMRAMKNLEEWSDKISIYRGYSQDVLPYFNRPAGTDIWRKVIYPGEWDLIIIDGDHRAGPVYRDAVLSLPLVKVGGWLLFDDVRQNIPKKDEVPEGLSQFLGEHGDQLEFIAAHRFMNCYQRIK